MSAEQELNQELRLALLETKVDSLLETISLIQQVFEQQMKVNQALAEKVGK
jgi:hypothetical protein